MSVENGARLYMEPDTSSEVLTRIAYGEEVELIESAKMWRKVRYRQEDGTQWTGWIAKRNVEE